MDFRDDQIPDRLNAMLARRRTDIAKAVDLLVELYGEQALDRATLLEKRSAVSGFARSVRETLAARIAAGTGTVRSLKTS